MCVCRACAAPQVVNGNGAVSAEDAWVAADCPGARSAQSIRAAVYSQVGAVRALLASEAGRRSLYLNLTLSLALSGDGWAVQQCTNGMLIQNGYAPTWNNLDLQVEVTKQAHELHTTFTPQVKNLRMRS